MSGAAILGLVTAAAQTLVQTLVQSLALAAWGRR